jgi:hypothetical protein
VRTLPDLCTDLVDALDRFDVKAATTAFRAAAERAESAPPGELTAALLALRPGLATAVFGNGAPLAILASGLVEHGGDPTAALDVLVERVAAALEVAAAFPAAATAAGVDPAAHPRSLDESRAVIARLVAAGVEEDQAPLLTQSWFTVDEWIPGLLLPLQQKVARRSLPQRDRLTAATAAVADDVANAHWLYGLLLVLDDEELIVVHRATGTVYAVTVSGIGDNFQLHTLLAATLPGVADPPPRPAWVAAATDGEMAPPGGISGQFNLVDAAGGWIWNEGRPHDIPPVAGRRVVVLDPPPYERTWNIGRAYPLMRPEIRLDRTLPAEEAGAWVRLIAPSSSGR